jgi:preprotein translocase SecE subunit
MYLCGGVVLFYLSKWTMDWLWGYFGGSPSELVMTLAAAAITLTAAAILYRHDRVYTAAYDVAAELKKVTWPTAKEVRAATIVVMVMAVIAGIVLLAFDTVWSNLTELVYG